MDRTAGRLAHPARGHSPARWKSHRLWRSSEMREPNYQFRDYPRAIAERAWQRLTGHHRWMTLDRFVAILSKTTNDETLSRDLVKAAVSSQSFCGQSGRRLVLFLPKPSPYTRRSEAWRVTAKEYADSTKRFAVIDLLDWYLQSVWVPTHLVEDWCSKKSYERHANVARASQGAMIPKEARPRPGPKEKYDWESIKATVFSLMDTYGEFCRERGWIQARLIDRILEEFDDKQPDESVLKRRIPDWLNQWRETRKQFAP